MDNFDEAFERMLALKLAGGQPLDVFVSDSIYLGGFIDPPKHQPMVAVGPTDWEHGEELTDLFETARPA